MLLAGCASFRSAPGGGDGKAIPGGVGHGVIVGDVTYPCFINSITHITLDTDDFEILETVTATTSSTSILRAAGADDVINVKADTREQSILMGFWKRATTKLTGTAIRWKKK